MIGTKLVTKAFKIKTYHRVCLGGRPYFYICLGKVSANSRRNYCFFSYWPRPCSDAWAWSQHCNDVIMGPIASQITSLTIVYSAVYSDADQRKHQSSASLAFVRGIHRGPVNSPHKLPVTRKIFPYDWLRTLLTKTQTDHFCMLKTFRFIRYHRCLACLLYGKA